MDENKLYNLVSGRPVSDHVADSLLNAMDSGRTAHTEFLKRLDINGSKSFFDGITKTNPKTFQDEKLKLKLKKADNSEVTVHRDVLGTLLAISNKENKLVDINKALGPFPCSTVCAPLSTNDGANRKTSKSAMYK